MQYCSISSSPKLYLDETPLKPSSLKYEICEVERKILIFFEENNIVQKSPIEKMYDYFDIKRGKTAEKAFLKPLSIRKYSQNDSDSIRSNEKIKGKLSEYSMNSNQEIDGIDMRKNISEDVIKGDY